MTEPSHTEYVAGYADTMTPVPGAEPSRYREQIERQVSAATERAERHTREWALLRAFRDGGATVSVPAPLKYVLLSRQVTDWTPA